MNLHGNHRTCPSSRRLLCERVVEDGWAVRRAAVAAGCSERTAAKWLARYRSGDRVLADHSSRPRHCPRRLPADRVDAIERLRRVRMTASEIAEVLQLPLSTVSVWLKRLGLGKRSRLDPVEPVNRYERRHPGELVHVDIKQLARISIRGAGHRVTGERSSQWSRRIDGRKRQLTGFEYLHVIIDDHSRLAYAEVLETLTSNDADRLPATGDRLVRRTGSACRGGDERQRLRLYQPPLRGGAARARPTPPAHPAVPAADQRQGRTAHPDVAQRVGIRPHLRQLARAHSRPPALPRPLQLPTTTRQPRPPTTGHETEQPI